MNRSVRRIALTLLTVLLTAPLLAAPPASDYGPAVVSIGASDLVLSPGEMWSSAALTVSGPGNFRIHQSFGSGESIAVDLLADATVAEDVDGDRPAIKRSESRAPLSVLSDGRYRYELVTRGNDGETRTSSGIFMVFDGRAMARETMRAQMTDVRADLHSEAQASNRTDGLNTKTLAAYSTADYLAVTDGVDDGLTVITLDSDLPANNQYFHVVNDQGDLDFESNTSIFPGSGRSELFLSRGGNVGMGTRTPADDLEIASLSPTIRLSDTNGPVEWEINSNPTSTVFDLVSTVNSAALTRHITVKRGAPANQLYLDTQGIGVGTPNPSATLEIEGSSGTSQLLIDEQGANASVEVMFNLVCNCSPGFRMQNTVNGATWFFRHTAAGDFSFDNVGSAGLEARLDDSGNFFIQGSLSQGSSRALKENLKDADGERILESLDDLSLYEWSYIDQGARHVGPMAEEFAKAYGLGESSAKIAPSDMAGVALAAVKTLNTTLKQRNQELEQQLGALLERVEALEVEQ